MFVWYCGCSRSLYLKVCCLYKELGLYLFKILSVPNSPDSKK